MSKQKIKEEVLKIQFFLSEYLTLKHTFINQQLNQVIQNLVKYNKTQLSRNLKMTQVIQYKPIKYQQKQTRKIQLIQELLEIPQQQQNNPFFHPSQNNNHKIKSNITNLNGFNNKHKNYGYIIKQNTINNISPIQKNKQQINQDFVKLQKIKNLQQDYCKMKQNKNEILDEYILEKYNSNIKNKQQNLERLKVTSNKKQNLSEQQLKSTIKKLIRTSDKQIQFPQIVQQIPQQISNYLDYFESISKSQSSVIKESNQSKEQSKIQKVTKNNSIYNQLVKSNHKYNNSQNVQTQLKFKSNIRSDQEPQIKIKIKEKNIKKQINNEQFNYDKKKEKEGQKQSNISFNKFQVYEDSQKQHHFNQFIQQKTKLWTKNDDKVLEQLIQQQNKHSSEITSNSSSKLKIQVPKGKIIKITNKKKSNKREPFEQISQIKRRTEQEISQQEHIQLEKFIVKDVMVDVDQLKQHFSQNLSGSQKSVMNVFNTLNNKLNCNQIKKALDELKNRIIEQNNLSNIINQRKE